MGQDQFWKKRVFDPFLTHLWSQNGPFSRHFGIFHWPKRITTGSKWAKNTCLSIPGGLGTILEKIIFFSPGTLVDPLLAPTVRGAGCPLASPIDYWYGGLGVSLGNCEAWKPQKLGGGGWTRCHWNLVSKPLSPKYGLFLFLGMFDTNCSHFGPFLAIFGPFLGHIVELDGNKGLFVTRKSRRT